MALHVERTVDVGRMQNLAGWITRLCMSSEERREAIREMEKDKKQETGSSRIDRLDK